MKILFDSSVLIAASIKTHPENEVAFNCLQKAHQKYFNFIVASHSLAECYAVLTTLPITPKISSLQAQKIIQENIIDHAKLIALTIGDMKKLIKEAADLSLKGGIIYDALILHAAIKEKVDKILTLNIKDFNRLNKSFSDHIIHPSKFELI